MKSHKKPCPHCGDSPLHIHHYHGEELDQCRRCGGLWFEKANLDQILAHNDGDVATISYTEHLGKRKVGTRMSCPDCNKKLHCYHLLDSDQLALDICRDCEGVWVEKHELDRVAHSSAIRSALQRLDAGISLKTWVFQFLSQMPVEYNVKPRTKPVVTTSLIVINSLIFLLYFFDSATTNYVVSYFAVAATDILAGQQLWTLITHMFLHGSWLHLISNMYFLWLVGDNLEDVMGRYRYLGLYLACGVGAALVSIAAAPNSPIPSVGASGAIAGLFGMYLLWFPKAKLTFMLVVFQFKLNVLWYFAIWLGINIFGMLMGGQGIDYWAHIGGFVIGLMIGYNLRERIWASNPLLSFIAKAR